MNDHRANDTLPSLDSIVRVVPRSTIVCSDPLVREAIAWSNGTLGDRWDAIVLGVVELTNAVEVNAGTIVLQLVVDSDDDCITPVGLDDGSRHVIIDRKSNTLDAVWGDCDVGDVQVVVHSSTGLGGEFVVVSSDIGATVGQRTALALARYAIFVNSFALEDSRCFRCALGEGVSAGGR